MVGYSWARLDAAILVLERQVEVFCLEITKEVDRKQWSGSHEPAACQKLPAHGPIKMDGYPICEQCEHGVPRNHVKLHLFFFIFAVQRNLQVSWLSTHRRMKCYFICSVLRTCYVDELTS